MGAEALVVAFERITDDDGHGVAITVDASGGPLVKAQHFDSCGEDSPPLAGDFAAINDAPGCGAQSIAGYVDPKNLGKALGGEKRGYARDPNSGVVVCEMWQKGDGSIHIEAIKSGSDITISTLQSGGKIHLNGVVIDAQGNVTTPGEVTAKLGTAPVKLSTHVHPTAGTGAPSPPTPGT